MTTEDRKKITFDSDKTMSVLGVPGRLTHRTVKPGSKPGVWTRQRWISEAREIKDYGADAKIQVEMRFDDECGNGHNTFTITAEVRRPRARDIEAGGMMHDEIREVFPELAGLLKWHLTSSDGPMHYIANTVYFAGNRDFNGKTAGETSSFEYGVRFDDSPVTHRIRRNFYNFLQGRLGTGDFQVFSIAHEREPKTFSPHYSLVGFADKWHECPFSDQTQADEFCEALNRCKIEFVVVPTAWSEGKRRELDAARNAAVWPEATDEQLSVEPAELRKALEDRLPALLAEFKAAMESAGFVWAPEMI